MFDGGVFLLVFTYILPSIITITTAGISPISMDDKASSPDEPIGESITTISASFPTSINEVFNPNNFAVLPVAQAITSSAGISDNELICVIVLNIASGITPLPEGLSLPIISLSH